MAKVSVLLVGIVVGSWFGSRVWPFVLWLWDERQAERAWKREDRRLHARPTD